MRINLKGVSIEGSLSFQRFIPPDFSMMIDTSTFTNPLEPKLVELNIYKYEDSDTINGSIDWGDGNTSSVTEAGIYSHTYSMSNTYTISIDGTIPVLKFLTNSKVLISIDEFGNIGLKQLICLDAVNLSSVPIYLPDTIRSCANMFHSCTSLNDSNITAWDMKHVVSISGMFDNCTLFNTNLYNWNISNVTNTSRTFANAISFNQPLDKWDISHVNDMTRMFYNASKFNQPLIGWGLSLEELKL